MADPAKKKNFDRVPYATMAVVLARLEGTGAKLPDIAKEMGYSVGAPHEWRRAGNAPKAALLAAECLVRRQGPSAHHVMVLTGTCPAEDLRALRRFAESLGLKLTEV